MNFCFKKLQTMKVVYFAANFMNIISVQSLTTRRFFPTVPCTPTCGALAAGILLPKESGLCGVSWKHNRDYFFPPFTGMVGNISAVVATTRITT